MTEKCPRCGSEIIPLVMRRKKPVEPVGICSNPECRRYVKEEVK